MFSALVRSTSATAQRTRQALLPTFRLIGRVGFGRQGALAGGRLRFPARAHTPARRASSLFIGSLLIGVGVSLLQAANLGLSPYDVLVSGLLPRLPLSFGQVVWLVSAVLFTIAALLGERPSRWGIAYVLANGVAIDAVSGFINAPESLLARYFFVALSIVVISVGISLVVHSGSTGGAFELLMRAGEVRGWDRRLVRTLLEVGIFSLGLSLGGSFGPATIAVALLIGPLLGLTSQALEDHSRGRELRQRVATPEVCHPSPVSAR